MELVDYLPEYPEFSDASFYQDIYKKKEFYDLRDRLLSDGFFSHQKIVARFLSNWTLYHSLLLVHDTGTGKTGSAIAVFDDLVRKRPKLQVLYLSKNDTLLENFKNEALQRSSYLSSIWSRVTQKTAIDDTNFNTTRNRVLRDANITTITYSRFADAFSKSPQVYIKQYRDGLILFDEVHHLVSSEVLKMTQKRKKDGEDIAFIYKNVHMFLHSLSQRKVVLMTATPMRNAPNEIASILNLCLSMKDQLPTGKDFDHEYFIQDTRQPNLPVFSWKPGKEDQFRRVIKGLVSVVKQNVDVQTDFRGQIYPPMQYFKIVAHTMSDLQTQAYSSALLRDKADSKKKKTGVGKRESSVFSYGAQASLCVFPNGAYGNTDKTSIYFSSHKAKLKKLSSAFFKETELKKKASQRNDILKNLDIIKRLSSTYYEIIRQIITNPNELVYIYCDRIQGSGIWTCIRFLIECFEYQLVTTSRNFPWDKPRRQCIFLNDTNEGTTKTDIMNLIQIFNDPRNRFGNYIQVIFGTDKTREGITLKNIRQIHITTADWNFGKIFQAIGRGIRLLSHEALGPNISVKIFFHCSVPDKNIALPPETLISVVDEARHDIVDEPVGDDSDTENEEDPLEELNAPIEVGGEDHDEEVEFDEDDILAELEYELSGIMTIKTPREVFTRDQLLLSLDFYKYYRSEIRDKNIKLVEYAMLVSAFDCALQYNDNKRRQDVLDLSPECMYKPCQYTCDGITQMNIPENDLDLTTFNLYYSKQHFMTLVEKVQELLALRFSISLQDLWDTLCPDGFTQQQVLEAVYWLIAQPIPIRYKDGRLLYVARHDDVFFLIDDRVALSWVGDPAWMSYYARFPSFDTHSTFERLSDDLVSYTPVFETLFAKLVENRNREDAIRIFQSFTLPQQMFIQDEVIRLLTDRPPECEAQCMDWVEWSRTHLFSKSIFLNDDGSYHLLRDGKFFKWSENQIVVDDTKTPTQLPVSPETIEHVEERTDHNSADFIDRYITKNKYKIYGFVEDNDFKIRDVRKNEKDLKDKKEKTKGKKCTSFRISELVYYVWSMGVRFPQKMPTLHVEEWNIIRDPSMTKERKNLLTKHERVMDEFSRLVSKNETGRENFVLYFASFKKDELCQLLNEEFQKRQIMTAPPILETKKEKTKAVKSKA